jgi:hypothetical protein
VAQQNVNSGTINKLEAEISRLREELARAEQRATAAEEVSIQKSIDTECTEPQSQHAYKNKKKFCYLYRSCIRLKR